ncbi:hypothetical protein ACFVRB_24560 [Streptomyces nojiriensis]|uniref:hypothetical protein n=1 Tax=Streptomyces nojiriensis TaxID=66374 RepID=UPI0036DD736B
MGWTESTLSHLMGMLDACRMVIARDQEKEFPTPGLELMGAQEWTISWGMDDGIIVVRFTVARDQDREFYGVDKPIPVRVVVAAGSKGTLGPDVKLPRYAEPDHAGRFAQESGFVELRERDQATTKWLTDIMLEGVGGDASTIREELGGALSFRVLLTDH